MLQAAVGVVVLTPGLPLAVLPAGSRLREALFGGVLAWRLAVPRAGAPRGVASGWVVVVLAFLTPLFSPFCS